MKMLRHKFALTTVVLVASLSTAAIAEEASGRQFKPIIFLQSESNLQPEQENVLLRAISQGINYASLRTLSSNMYGTGSKFKNNTKKTPAVSILRGFTELDSAMDREILAIQPQLAALPDDATWSFTVELLWHKNSDALPREKFLHPGQDVRDLATVLEFLIAEGHVPAGEGKEYFDLATTPIVDVSNDLDIASQYYSQGREAYEELASETQAEWLPFYSRVTFTLINGALNARYATHLKPAEYYESLREQNGGFFIEEISYLPSHFGSEKQSLMRAELKRRYGDPTKVNPDHMLISFGSMTVGEMNSFVMCENLCVDMVNKIPTIKAAVSLGANSNRRLYHLIDYALADKVDIFILLKSLAVGSGPDGELRIIPEHSSTPIVIREKSYFTGTPTYYLINQNSQYFGFNIYDRLVRHQVADGLTADLRDTVAGLDKDTNKTLTHALNGLLESISRTK